MFSYIKNLFQSEKAPDMHPFYGAAVIINGNEIRLKRNNGDNEAISIEDIDYISIYRFEYLDTHDRCWLNFRSYTKQSLGVCTLAGGFAAVEQFAITCPNFDKAQYDVIRASKVEVKETLLWQKTHQADFIIEPLPTAPDALSLLQQGLWIENKKTLIAWGTFEELSKNKLIQSKLVNFPNPLFSAKNYTISKPTIFNGLTLTSIDTECDAAEGVYKLDLPVLQYRAKISLGFNRQKSFDGIKSHLDGFFEHATSIDYAVKDTWRVQWQVGMVRVELYCFYRDVPDGWDNIAWLTIQHAFNVDRFYTNDYQRNLVLSAAINYQLFDFNIALNVDYRRIQNAIYTPDCFNALITDAQQLLVWHDTNQQVIGFASNVYALIFNANDVQLLSLAVQNFRGSEGRNNLEIHYQNAMVHVGSVSNVAVFKKQMKKLATLINKKVNSYTYDEHY